MKRALITTAALFAFVATLPSFATAAAKFSEVVVMNDEPIPVAPVGDDTVSVDNLPAVHVDPVHAGQVVMNLLTNAVQAMGARGGKLTLRGRPNGGSTVLLEVTDTGPGVAPENLTRIFEPLFTTKARGIGLGLAVSKAFCDLMGYELEVTSEVGEGSTFRIILSRSAAADAMGRPERSPRAISRRWQNASRTPSREPSGSGSSPPSPPTCCPA